LAMAFFISLGALSTVGSRPVFRAVESAPCSYSQAATLQSKLVCLEQVVDGHMAADAGVRGSPVAAMVPIALA
jgi:hypothetical protein